MRQNMNLLSLIGLWILGLGMLTSTSLVGLVHIFFFLPCLYFLFFGDRKMSPSMWILLALILILIASVLFNLEVFDNPSRSLSRTRYFVLGLLSTFALRALFKEYLTEAKAQWLIRFTLIAVTVATVSGLIGLWTGYNPLRFSEAHSSRNSGLHSMLMTYAYGLSLFMVLLTGLITHGKKVQQLISKKWLLIFFAINLVGLYFTHTRGAYLGFLAGVPFLFFKDHKKLFAGLSVLFIALISFVVYFEPGGVRVFQGGSDGQRIAFFQTAIKAAEERPVLGWGYRNFEPHVTDIKSRYPEIGYPDRGGHAHSNFFEFLASTGYIGAFLFVVFTFMWAYEMYRRNDLIGRLTFAYVASFTVSGLFQFTWGDAPITAMTIKLFAISFASPKVDER